MIGFQKEPEVLPCGGFRRQGRLTLVEGSLGGRFLLIKSPGFLLIQSQIRSGPELDQRNIIGLKKWFRTFF